MDTVVPPQTVRFSGFGRGRDLDGDGDDHRPGGRAHARAAEPAGEHRPARRAAPDGAGQHGAGARDRPRRRRRRRRREDLRRDGVVYYAQSLGGIYGTMLMGVDQRVRAGALNVPGGPILDIARQSPAFRALVAADLKNRRPGLLNGGRDGFTESVPLFPDPPVTKPARGAVAIQDAFAAVNWLNRAGSPETFAPLLRRTPLGGVGAKKVLYQFAYGDQTVPNPTSATLMRAGGLQDVTTFYRNDRTPTAGTNPHGFLLDPTLTGRNLGQAQVLDFLASGGVTISDPGRPGAGVRGPDRRPGEPRDAQLQRRTPATGEPPPEARRRRDRARAPGRRHGLAHRMRGAGRLQEREGAPARAPGALRVLAPRGRPRDRRGLPGLGRAAPRRQPADRALHGPQAVVHVERAPRPQRPPVRPLPRARGQGRQRRPARHAAPQPRPLPARALVLPPPQLRPADASSSSARPVFGGARNRPARVAFRLASPARVTVRVLPRRQGRQDVPDPAPGAHSTYPPARGVAARSPAAPTASASAPAVAAAR